MLSMFHAVGLVSQLGSYHVLSGCSVLLLLSCTLLRLLLLCCLLAPHLCTGSAGVQTQDQLDACSEALLQKPSRDLNHTLHILPLATQQGPFLHLRKAWSFGKACEHP